ncbi:HU family DNA-binding protein [Geodermatophilus maliterrae]|uniref:HU family DNA-binding protein n=1 Tax=Geodermatophilus maliterrae TaxID=3162531 RepID=A0ABV3XC40_9ACTN
MIATRRRRAPVNKSDLIARMTERLSGDRATAVAAVNGVLEEIEGSVARGERVSLSGFGTFDRRERAPRLGRNPRTGEAIRVGASVVPVFRAGTGFKTLLSRADGVSMSPGSAAVEGGPRAEGEKSRAAASGSPAGTVVVAADAAADGRKKAGKKAGKKARDRAGEKGGKSARKAAKGKAGKKAAKGLRRPRRRTSCRCPARCRPSPPAALGAVPADSGMIERSARPGTRGAEAGPRGGAAGGATPAWCLRSAVGAGPGRPSTTSCPRSWPSAGHVRHSSSSRAASQEWISTAGLRRCGRGGRAAAGGRWRRG